MVTVIDPNGMPVPVYERDGIVIIPITAAHDPIILPAPAVISSPSDYVIALVSVAHNERNTIELPDLNIGGLVELYIVGNDQIEAVSPPSGQNINGFSSISQGTPVRYRKISATDWRSFNG